MCVCVLTCPVDPRPACSHFKLTVSESEALTRAGLEPKSNPNLNQLSVCLPVVQGTTYSCGEEVTSADFHLWEMLDQHELLVRVRKRECSMPEVRLYAGVHVLICKR